MGRLAVAQLRSTPNRDSNFEATRTCVDDALKLNAQFLCFPEAFEHLGASSFDTVAMAEPLDGPLMSRYRSLSAESHLWLSLGGFHEIGVNNRIYNTHVIVSPPNGDIVATYRKMHLFDVHIPGKATLKESDTTIPGDTMYIVRNTPIGDVGLSTCYDLRFPALYQCMGKAGAHVVLVPSAFLQHTGHAHWEVLLRARAIENQVYIAAAAQTGMHSSRRSSYGHSMIVGPWGDIIEDAGTCDRTVIATDVDFEHLTHIRQAMPVFEHRRDDIFGELPQPNSAQK